MVISTLIGQLLARLGKKMRLTLQIGLVLAWANAHHRPPPPCTSGCSPSASAS